MIHKNRKNRRYIRDKKIKKRLRLMKELGSQSGTMYEKHVEKIETKGGGYMAKSGTFTHYSQKSHYGRKTRDRNNYGKSENWKVRDKRQMEDSLIDFDE